MSEQIFLHELVQQRTARRRHFPDKELAQRFVNKLFAFLFVGDAKDAGYEQAEAAYRCLQTGLASLLSTTAKGEAEAAAQTKTFFAALPALYKTLLEDAQAILDFDPAAQSLAEVTVAYPGFFATAVYRFAHRLWLQNLPPVSRLFTEYAHGKTGIDIHPGAQIGSAFAIDHGTGIVVGETAVIGRNVKLYQGVTLGALNVEKSLARSKRHPTIEDDVVIYAGATILGGDTVIGCGSIVGGNVWLTQSVPPGTVVYHQSQTRLKDKNPFPQALHFII